MRRTSRRAFGKQLAGAAAALPLASLATSAQQSAKEQQQQKARGEEIYYHENTPPPVSIEEGSLKILLPGNKPFDEPPSGTQPRYVYTVDLRHGSPLPVMSNEIAHLRILQGNGDILYSSYRATGSWIKVELQNRNGQRVGDVKIRGGNLFTADSDARLMHSPTGGGNLKHTYNHPGSAVPFRVRSIKVALGDPDVAGSTVLFLIDLGTDVSTFLSQEFRVLIWPQ